jgi:hypothetical protein
LIAVIEMASGEGADNLAHCQGKKWKRRIEADTL